jgi:hypothetical protein
MSKERPNRPSGSEHEPEHGEEHRRKFAHDKGNAAHIEVEERRFRGGLPPTPELYSTARDQWNQLPGSVVRPSLNTTVNQPAASNDKPESDEEDKKGNQEESR